MVILTTFRNPKFFSTIFRNRLFIQTCFNTNGHYGAVIQYTLPMKILPNCMCWTSNVISKTLSNSVWLGAGHSKQKSNKGWGLLFRTHKKFLESFVPLTRYIIHNTKILSKLFSFFLKLFTLNYHNTFIYTTHEHIVTHCIIYINMLIIMYNVHYLMYKYTHYSRKNYSEIQSENQL